MPGPLPPSPHWPAYLPRQLVKPDTTLAANLEIAARRYGQRTAIGFLGRDVSYDEWLESARHLAGWLQHVGIQPGDRVMLFLQNTPQWLIAYYGILLADAVLVPANPMYRPAELTRLLQDSGCRALICSSDLAATATQAMAGTAVDQWLVTDYADYLPATPVVELPDWLRATGIPPAGATTWRAALEARHEPAPSRAQPQDLATIHYTSGSTGVPKGCMHSHQTLMHTTVGLSTWHGHAPGTVFLGVAPFYQVAGFTVAANCAVYVGGTVVPMPRWDRRLALSLIQHYQVRFGGVAPTALIDMLSDPELDHFDLSSLKRVSFGGASMPDSVWQQLHERLGLSFIEAYGMTEMAATTHINPVHRPRRQCLGIPFFDTHSLVVHPDSVDPCGPDEAGEILVAGPQQFLGYWNQPDETARHFVEIEGVRYFRSGDIGRRDDEGYFFMTDRAKRMINASGFKVWPAEVENLLYEHPAVREACVIATPDAYRGESVKALIVLRDGHADTTSEQDIIDWCRSRMAAYKYPRQVAFVPSLPKSAVGKILWRELQDAENARHGDSADASARHTPSTAPAPNAETP